MRILILFFFSFLPNPEMNSSLKFEEEEEKKGKIATKRIEAKLWTVDRIATEHAYDEATAENPMSNRMVFSRSSRKI